MDDETNPVLTVAVSVNIGRALAFGRDEDAVAGFDADDICMLVHIFAVAGVRHADLIRPDDGKLEGLPFGTLAGPAAEVEVFEGHD